MLPLLLGTSERGIFVEICANDGIHGSNTLMLERCFNWTGLLIEASPDTFIKLLSSHSAVQRWSTRLPARMARLYR